MTPRNKMMASDVYHETEHSFGSKIPFEKAFPQIEQFSIETIETEGVEQVDFNAFDKIKHRRIYTMGSLPGEFIVCRNPGCHKGGLSISCILRKMISEKLSEFQGTEHCPGFEGSPKGRKNTKIAAIDFIIKLKLSIRKM